MGTCVSTEKSLFDARERQSAEMVGLGTAFPCVPIDFNPRSGLPVLNFYSGPRRRGLTSHAVTLLPFTRTFIVSVYFMILCIFLNMLYAFLLLFLHFNLYILI